MTERPSHSESAPDAAPGRSGGSPAHGGPDPTSGTRPGGSIAVFALTPGGARTAGRIVSAVGGGLHLPERLVEASGGIHLTASAEPGSATVGFTGVAAALQREFEAGTALVCVMATGIVVRSIAPVLRSKLEDPAVLVVDELGRFVVPLLSGHVGGANALARRIAQAIGAQAVLTTSTDVQGILGPDLLAVALDAHVEDPAVLLPVSAALAAGRPVDLWVDPAEVGGVSAFLSDLVGYRLRAIGAAEPGVPASPGIGERAEVAVVVTASVDRGASAGVEAEVVLRLVPRWTVAGVGCTRGTPAATLVSAVREALDSAGLREGSLRALASVRAKSDEPGLAEAAAELGVPLVFADDEHVEAQIAAYDLAESEWVKKSIGVGAASEPAALWAAGPGAELVQHKIARDGITVALARMDGEAVVAAREERWEL